MYKVITRAQAQFIFDFSKLRNDYRDLDSLNYETLIDDGNKLIKNNSEFRIYGYDSYNWGKLMDKLNQLSPYRGYNY